MKSKTSCYDPATGRMTVRRFVPAWVLYTLGLLLYTAMGLSGNGSSEVPTEDRLYFIKYYISMMGIFNFGYALVLAQLLFGDLYTPRLCYAIHALPVTRGGWFGTQIILGIVGSLLSNLLNAGVLLLFLKEFRITVLWWLAASELQFLFFFGVAVLCAICGANRFGMLILYGIVNFAYVLGAWLWMKLYACLIYGMSIRDFNVTLSPLMRIVNGGFFTIHTTGTWMPHPRNPGQFEKEYTLDGVSLVPDFWLLFAYAAVGVAAIWLAMRLYRKRKNECAGDLLAFPKLELPVLILCTLAVGGAGHLVAYVFNVNMRYPMLFIGMIVGYYVCLMLLKRQINVFTGKSVPPLAALCAAMLLSLALTGLDPLGIADRVPDAQEVATASMTDTFSDGRVPQTSDPEAIAEILEVHRQALRDYQEREASRPLLTRIFGDEGEDIRFSTSASNEDVQRSSLFFIFYTMKDGSTLNRVYRIPETSPATENLRKYFSRPEEVFADWAYKQQYIDENGSLDAFLDCVNTVRFNCYHRIEDDRVKYSETIDPEEIRNLTDAILADCAQGNAAQIGMLHGDEKIGDYVGFHHTYYSSPDDSYRGYYVHDALGIDFNLTIYPECTNTLNWLAEHGYHEYVQPSTE